MYVSDLIRSMIDRRLVDAQCASDRQSVDPDDITHYIGGIGL